MHSNNLWMAKQGSVFVSLQCRQMFIFYFDLFIDIIALFSIYGHTYHMYCCLIHLFSVMASICAHSSKECQRKGWKDHKLDHRAQTTRSTAAAEASTSTEKKKKKKKGKDMS